MSVTYKIWHTDFFFAGQLFVILLLFFLGQSWKYHVLGANYFVIKIFFKSLVYLPYLVERAQQAITLSLQSYVSFV